MSLKLVLDKLGEKNEIKNININNIHNASSFVSGDYENTDLNNKSNQGKNLYYLGKSVLGENQVLSYNYKGYISSVFSNSNGIFETPITITIEGNDLMSVEIQWDNTCKEYATTMVVNGVYYNYDSFNLISNIDFTTPTDTITIQITSWSKANANCKITSITCGLSLTYDRKNGLLSVTRGSQSIDDNSNPIYSLIGSYGSAEFYDNNNTIEYLVINDLINDNVNASVYYNNVQIGKYMATNFKKDGLKIKIDLIDFIEQAQNYNIGKTIFTSDNTTLYDVFTNLCVKLNDLGLMFYSPQDIIDRMKNIVIAKNTFLSEGSLWEQFEKVATIMQLNISTNESGYLCFKDIPNNVDNPIVIKPQNIIGKPQYSIIKNNIYKNPQINYNLGFNYKNEPLEFTINLFTTDKNIGGNYVPFYKPKNRDGNGDLTGGTPQVYDEGYYYNINSKENDVEILYVKENVLETLFFAQTIVHNNVYFRKKISESNKYYDLADFNQKIVYVDYKDYVREYLVNTLKWKEDNVIENQNDVLDTLSLKDELDDYDYVINNINNLTNSFKLVQENGDLYFYVVMPTMTYFYDYTGTAGIYKFVNRMSENIRFKFENGTYFSSSGNQTLVYDNSKQSDYTISSNELINKDIASNILQNVYDNYNKGLRSVNLTCFIDNYYDINGNLVYNKNGNDILKVGDIVIPYELKGNKEFAVGTLGLGNPIKFKITSCELEYKGSNKLHLEMIEYKE